MRVLLLAAILLLAAGWDLLQRRIPNPLVLCGLLLGPAAAAAELGPERLLGSGLGILLAFALTWPQWALRWMGGGDAKLFIVIGAFLGPMGMVHALIYSLAINGLLALGMLIAKKVQSTTGISLVKDLRVPMAVAIVPGTALALLVPFLPAPPGVPVYLL